MEWKKEKVSAAELERSRKEYMSAAMSMLKRSSSAVKVVPEEKLPETPETPPPETETPPPETETPPPETETAEAAQTVQPADAEPEENVQVSVTEVQQTETAEEKTEEAEKEKEEKQQTGETAEVTELQEEECEKEENYGVYTAEEVLQAKDTDSGLRKAAEILEEMTRNTAIMKKLASDMGEDDDTTDFPDFSCDTGDGDCSFRDGYATDSASAELSETSENKDE